MLVLCCRDDLLVKAEDFSHKEVSVNKQYVWCLRKKFVL